MALNNSSDMRLYNINKREMTSNEYLTLFDRYMDMTLFQRDILSISNLIFKPRMHTGRIRSYYPIGSPVMREMTQYKRKEIESIFLKGVFSRLPILTSCPPSLYYGSAYYLASIVVSISKHQFVMRRPLPILDRIVKAYSYRSAASRYFSSEYSFRGLMNKVLIFKERNRLIDMTVKISDLMDLLEKRYTPISSFLDRVKADINPEIWKTCSGSILSVVRHGYSIWYTLIPALIMNIGVFKTHGDILTPDILQSIKDNLLMWAASDSMGVNDALNQINGKIMIAESTSADVTESDKIMMEASKIVVSRLVIASLTVCILATVTYITGEDLLQEYSDLNLRPLLDGKVLHFLAHFPVIVKEI